MSDAAKEKWERLGLLERERHALDRWLRSLDDCQLDRPVFRERPRWRVGT